MSALSFSVQEIILQVEDANEASSSDPWGSQTIFLLRMLEVIFSQINTRYEWSVYIRPSREYSSPLAQRRQDHWYHCPRCQTDHDFGLPIGYSAWWNNGALLNRQWQSSCPTDELTPTTGVRYPTGRVGGNDTLSCQVMVMEGLHQYRFYSYPLQLNIWIRHK